MAKFYDIKISEYNENLRFKNGDFSVWTNLEYWYEVPSDSSISIITILKDFLNKKENNKKLSLDYSNFNQNILDKALKLDLDMISILAEMELDWIFLEKNDLMSIELELKNNIKSLEKEIFLEVWHSFNINSSKQLQVILFEELKIKPIKKTKTWFSTDADTLNILKQDYEIIKKILEYRSFSKLLSTYAKWLQKYINNKTHRIHTVYNLTETSTWRLSSKSPNMQNIPTGDYYSDKIKSAFKAKAWYKLVSYDYSQIEIRVLAFLSQDTNLLNAFYNNEDIHTKTAKYIFNKKNISAQERKYAKSINFWVIYWISPFGLSKMISLSIKDCSKYIDAFYKAYPWIKKYFNNVINLAKNKWYVETLFWRKRYIPALNDANKTLRLTAEREAINMPVQWTASDIVKIAMKDISDFLNKNNYKSKMLLQIHDELVFEILDSEFDEVTKEIKILMEKAWWMWKLLKVDMWVWNNLLDAK